MTRFVNTKNPNQKAKRKSFSKGLRIKIFERDNYECQLCKPKKNLINLPRERIIDHKIPLSKGGTNCLANLWLLCSDCDKKKKNKLLDKLVAEYIKGKLDYLMNNMAEKRKNINKNKDGRRK